MSHAPETSLQLVLRIRVLKSLTEHVLTEQEATALIDAWVRVREAEAELNAKIQLLSYWQTRTQGRASEDMNMLLGKLVAQRESTLATARKQLEETR